MIKKVYILCSSEGCKKKLEPGCEHIVFANELARQKKWFRLRYDEPLWICPECKNVMIKTKKGLTIEDPPFLVEEVS